MPGERVLVIEDEPAMRRALADNFQFAGYGVQTAGDGDAGLRAALNDQPELIILDLMLPKVNGYEVCRQVRAAGLDTPIIMLTAKGQEQDIILGLNLGADDYVTKPFSINQLLARANALLRRRRGPEQEVHRFGPFELNRTSRRLLARGREVVLTPKEMALLIFLVRQAGRALTRDAILNAVWGRDVFVTRRSVDRCVTTLRGKIEADPRTPVYLQTVREIGYRFQEPGEPA
jgi:DNA-binding response OmpR family regulator